MKYTLVSPLLFAAVFALPNEIPSEMVVNDYNSVLASRDQNVDKPADPDMHIWGYGNRECRQQIVDWPHVKDSHNMPQGEGVLSVKLSRQLVAGEQLDFSAFAGGAGQPGSGVSQNGEPNVKRGIPNLPECAVWQDQSVTDTNLPNLCIDMKARSNCVTFWKH